jgi:hypothetical protein
MTDTVQELTSQARQQASELTSTVTGQAREQATSRASAQKDRAAQTLGSVASAITQVGDQLRSENPSIAQAADTIGQKLQALSDDLGTQDVSHLMQRAERFARQNPTAFLAGAFAIGFLGARFLKSSTPESERSDFYERGLSGRGSYGAYRAFGDTTYRTRPDQVTGHGASFDTTGYGATSATPTTGYGAETSRTSYSPYSDSTGTGGPTTES